VPYSVGIILDEGNLTKRISELCKWLNTHRLMAGELTAVCRREGGA
jgi:hypothetical protein